LYIYAFLALLLKISLSVKKIEEVLIKSRKKQTILKDRTQSFGFKARYCYDCQTADFFNNKKVGSFLFEILGII